jgi:hypothetical protein
MYVRTVAPITLTISDQHQDDDVLLDGNHPYDVLPLWAAQKEEFQILWENGEVEVATDAAFTNIITEIPPSEGIGGDFAALSQGKISESVIPNLTSLSSDMIYTEKIVDTQGHTVLRMVDGTLPNIASNNYIAVTNATTGNAPMISAESAALEGSSSDTNVDLHLKAFGAGNVYIKNDTGTMLQMWGYPNAINHMAFSSAAAGQAVEFGVVGQGGDVDVRAYTSGTGRFYVNSAPVITGVQLLNNQGMPRWSYNSPTNSLGQYAVQENSLAVGLPNPSWAADIVASPGDYLISFNDGPQNVPISAITGPSAGTNVYTLTGAWPANATGFPITIAAAVSQSYTLQANDVGKLIAVNSGDTFTVNIPLNTGVNFQVGARIELAQTGTGGVYVSLANEAITLISHQGWTALNGRGATATLTLVAQNTWLLAGSLD